MPGWARRRLSCSRKKARMPGTPTTSRTCFLPGTQCPACGGTNLRKETDILDVWFDSGSSHAAVLGHRPDLPWPSDVYLEGGDQYRGWFHSSLLVGMVTRGAAPYRAVLTNGWALDAQGRAMSKSLGQCDRSERGHQDPRSGNPAAVGGFRRLPRRRCHLARYPGAIVGGLPQTAQYLPLLPLEPLRF